MALGAFLAGVLLAESEYRHEIQAAVEPFKGLLLGLFFIAVGMGVDFGVLLARPLVVLALVGGLFAVKGGVLWLIARRAGLPASEVPLFILLLAPGSEFAFVVLGPGAAGALLAPQTIQAITLAVALSMLATPFLIAIYDRLLAPRLGATPATTHAAEAPQAGTVILAGLGRVGQVVARLLNGSGYHPTVLDDDPDHVEQSRKLGFRVFYGDATRLDLLHAAGADSAAFLIITLDEAEAITRLARTARKHFPNLRVIARAHDMRHLFELRDLGVDVIERETWRSALKLGEAALAAVSGDPERAQRAVLSFAEHDQEVVSKLYEVHRSAPDAHITVSNELRDQFARTLKADEASLQEDQAMVEENRPRAG
jgi:glutathione-regulated potassium-efflux system ancillary protein KefC